MKWRKSSYCSDAACVEVAHQPGRVLMRDSKDPSQTPLEFPDEAWAAFLKGVRAGEFDR